MKNILPFAVKSAHQLVSQHTLMFVHDEKIVSLIASAEFNFNRLYRSLNVWFIDAFLNLQVFTRRGDLMRHPHVRIRVLEIYTWFQTFNATS